MNSYDLTDRKIGVLGFFWVHQPLHWPLGVRHISLGTNDGHDSSLLYRFESGNQEHSSNFLASKFYLYLTAAYSQSPKVTHIPDQLIAKVDDGSNS
jgi:hypothetical protein